MKVRSRAEGRANGREVNDGFGTIGVMCDREDCDLQVVRPGKFQCRGEYDEIGCCWGPEEGKTP